MYTNLNWGSNHPGHLVFLLDLSGSMNKMNKIDNALDAVKQICCILLGRCMQGMKIKDRFSMSIIGYNSEVHTLFEGTVVDLDKKMDEIYNRGGRDAQMFDKTVELKDGGCHPQWLTYTAKAFRAVKADIEKWISEQQNNGKLIPVPVIFHITDGEPKESQRGYEDARKDALFAADEIKLISLPNGHPVLFNIHIGNGDEPELLFPSQRPDDKVLQFLYDSCSKMNSETGYDLIPIGSMYGPPVLSEPIFGELHCMASGVKNYTKFVDNHILLS